MPIYALFIAITLTTCSFADAKVQFDRKEKLKNISLKSGKENHTRTYRGSTSRTYPYSLEAVKRSITNFTERCNNTLKAKREFSNKESDCLYHNENMIESFLVKDLKSGWSKEEGETERFLVGRRVYNRATYNWYDLVQVIEGKTEDNKRTVTVNQRMLKNPEARLYTEPVFDKESAFSGAEVKYILTEISPEQTELKYTYEASTQHWILNKELSVPQVFSSITRSINDLLKSVALESDRQHRAIASESK